MFETVQQLAYFGFGIILVLLFLGCVLAVSMFLDFMNYLQDRKYQEQFLQEVKDNEQRKIDKAFHTRNAGESRASKKGDSGSEN